MEDALELPEYLAKIAFDEYGETPEKRTQALLDLRALIDALPCAEDKLEDTSDLSLIRFLRVRKYDLDSALKTTIELQRFRSAHKEWFDPTAEEIMKFCQFCRIPAMYDQHHRVIVCVHPIYATRIFTPEYLHQHPHGPKRFVLWLLDRLSHDVNVQVCGMVFVNSFHDVGFWEALQVSRVLTLSHLQVVLTYMTRCLKLRLAAAMIFEQPLFFTVLWPVLRTFMSEKIKSRFFLCGADYAQLRRVLGDDLRMLPAELGGEGPEDMGQVWIARHLELQQSGR
eukprot:gene28555-34467_t